MRILVAEDDDTTALVISRVLKRVGHEVVRASDGVAALSLVREGAHFDVILTDWMMPKMDGVALIQRLRQEVASLPPMVVLTAVASDEARERVLEAGADDYLAKPVQPDELLQCIHRVVGKHQQMWVARDSAPPVSEAGSGAETLPAPLVILTAGTGGPMALQKIFRALTCGERACFVVVQQGPKWMIEAFTHRLQSRTSLNVALARDGEVLKAGQVRVAPGDIHCVVDGSAARLRLENTAPVNYVKPSADVSFRSAARYGEGVIAVVLSGMGCDGAMGSEMVRLSGGRILVQDPTSAEAASMPQTVLDHARPTAVLPLERIGVQLSEWIAELRSKGIGAT